ncbi:MAG: DNA alkylation repair protein [Candidatus Paceibacterota bacterium]|jgi:3-methyladenine DNA glycosylase AlkD
MQTVEELKIQLRLFADVEKATLLQRFFKTGKGQYGEGDIFLGVMVPYTRKVAKKFTDLTLPQIKELLYSKIHEERLCALILLEEKYRKSDEAGKKIVFDFYIKNAKQANSWDLVDLFAPKIAGDYLIDKDKSILYKFAVSKNLWEKRIAILSTFWFIKYKKYNDSLKIAKILMNDKHDLIHKAIGWMLREIGKRDLTVEEKFLQKYYKKMPRTMLRYAIEKFSEEKRLNYLKKL